MSKSKLSFVILAAGMGTRLGRSLPKTLTTLANGKTILGSQVEAIRKVFGDDADINVVVGYRAEDIVEAHPDLHYIYNEAYDVTNTSQSLLKALSFLQRKAKGVVWLNGDLVFDDKALTFLRLSLEAMDENLVTVNTDSVSDEEVKYVVDEESHITQLSKTVNLDEALGEAVGINYVRKEDMYSLMLALKRCERQDYFERGIEIAIKDYQQVWVPFDITKFGAYATEVDFASDLEKANQQIISAGAPHN